MATRKGVSVMLLLLFLLGFLVLFFVVVVPFMNTSAQRVEQATEGARFRQVREIALIATEDLPDLKLEQAQLGQSASCINNQIQMHFIISNRGEGAAPVDDPFGIGVCSKSQASVFNWVRQPSGDFALGPEQFVGMNFYRVPTLNNLQASERTMLTDTFLASTNTCPGAFIFEPYVCAGELEELNKENNYLYVGNNRKSLFCSDVGQTCTGLVPGVVCYYNCELID